MTVRLTLDLSAKLNATLEQIAKDRDCTKADVLRSALQLLELAVDAKRQGYKVGAWRDSDGCREVIAFVGLGA